MTANIIFFSLLLATILAVTPAAVPLIQPSLPLQPPPQTQPPPTAASNASPQNPKIYYTPPVKNSMLHPISAPGVPVTSSVEFLEAHNKIRAQYNEPPLSWNNTLAEEAVKYAAAHAVDCNSEHTTGPYGENTFWSSKAGVFTAANVVEKWEEEKSFYDEKANTCKGEEECGHFLQLVWMDTKSVGCSMITCLNGGMVTMCFYYPPGNYRDKSPFQKYLKA